MENRTQNGWRSKVHVSKFKGVMWDLLTNVVYIWQNYHNYTRLGLFSRTMWVSRYHKGKTSLDLNEARDDRVLGCSGISWTICKKSPPLSRQITTPTPHHSFFLHARCSSWRPTNSVRALKAIIWHHHAEPCIQEQPVCTTPHYSVKLLKTQYAKQNTDNMTVKAVFTLLVSPCR